MRCLALLCMAIMMSGILGCSTVEERVDKNTANILLIERSTNNLSTDFRSLDDQVNKLVFQVNGLSTKIESQTSTAREPQNINTEMRMIELQLSIIEKSLERLEKQCVAGNFSPAGTTTMSVAAPAASKSGKPLLKVLSGTNDLAEAQTLAKRLTDKGYQVQAVDLAVSRDFRYDTVYFVPGYEQEAYRIAGILGSQTVVKSLTWHSVFNIIVVKGEK